MTTVLLADDHDIVRKGLRTLLDTAGDIDVVGEAADGLAVLPLVEELQPEILIVDVMMPGMQGLEVTRQVHERMPATRTIVLSMHANEAYVLDALQHGAWAYVLKQSSTDDIMQAIREVRAGRRYLSPPLSERAIAAYLSKTTSDHTTDAYERLTAREREVLYLAAHGRTNNEIAEQLVISPRTVETHRANVMQKLGLQSSVDLVKYAVRRGIITLED